MGFTEAGSPNVVLFTTEFQLLNTPRFNMFVASSRTSRFEFFIILNVRDIDEFKLNVSGPSIEFRRAVPHAAALGAVYAAGFKNCPDVPV